MILADQQIAAELSAQERGAAVSNGDAIFQPSQQPAFSLSDKLFGSGFER